MSLERERKRKVVEEKLKEAACEKREQNGKKERKTVEK